MIRIAAAVLALVLAGCAGAPRAPDAAIKDLAPTGKLRAAINYGNPILATKNASGGPAGVSPDLARELAKRLGVPLEFITFTSAGQVVQAVKKGSWDVAFVAIDPQRANEISQTGPYVQIEGAYLVRNSSPLRGNDEVDRAGHRVAVGLNSAYDLYLTRSLKQAQIVRAPTSPQVVDLFMKDNLEVAAGVKQQLEADVRRVPGLRLLPGRFMVINQAMATPRGRDAGAKYLAAFVEEMKSSSFVADALTRHKIQGASVAPAGPAQ